MMSKLTIDKTKTYQEIDRDQIHSGDIILVNVPTGVEYKPIGDYRVSTKPIIYKAMPALVTHVWSYKITVIPLGSDQEKTIQVDQMNELQVTVALKYESVVALTTMTDREKVIQ